jgi:oxidase EvaA
MTDSLAALQRELQAAAAGEGCPVLPGFDAATRAELFLSRYARQALHGDGAVAAWVAERRLRRRLRVRPVRLDALARWRIDPGTGNVAHETGRFFTVTGIRVRHRQRGRELEWDQPILDQPEVGILGILARRIDGVLHFCLQAKEEPGNPGGVQLSPTVQATWSNYTGVHGGELPPFVGHFLEPAAERVLFARLQSEDGGRFLFKSNRNMLLRLDEGEAGALPEDFIWLTLRQIVALLRRDNLLHATSRSVLAALLGCGTDRTLLAVARERRHAALWGETPPPATPEAGPACASLHGALQWLDDRKADHHILVRRTGLNALAEWEIDGNGFLAHREGRFFRVFGIDVSGDSREVPAWSQPILSNPETGIIGLLVRHMAGRRHFLMQAKAEAGNRTAVQLGPTVQFTPGNYTANVRLPKPFLFDEFSGRGSFPILWENLQAEEGARFYRESHRHRVLLLPEGVEPELPADFRWLSEEQVQFFLHLGETVNSCARSILSCLL